MNFCLFQVIENAAAPQRYCCAHKLCCLLRRHFLRFLSLHLHRKNANPRRTGEVAQWVNRVFAGMRSWVPIPSTHVEDRHSREHLSQQHLWSRDGQISRACWPASLAVKESLRLSERPCLKNHRGHPIYLSGLCMSSSTRPHTPPTPQMYLAPDFIFSKSLLFCHLVVGRIMGIAAFSTECFSYYGDQPVHTWCLASVT